MQVSRVRFLTSLAAAMLVAAATALVVHAAQGVVQELPCRAEEVYELGPNYGVNAYGSDCRRLRFLYGPITVKPGQNDALLEPVVIDKPPSPGYIVRFKAYLYNPAVAFEDDSNLSPLAEGVHLHHAVWASTASGDNYFGAAGWDVGPLFATGEERTIQSLPTGYGLEVKPQDTWVLLYMIQNMTTVPREVFVAYEVDFIERSRAEALGIVPVEVIWLDVQRHRIHREAPEHPLYPVFNIQKGFGEIDPETRTRVCTWPRENCARHDPFGEANPHQGKSTDASGKPLNIPGADYLVNRNHAGSLVWIGGHLHPGGIRDEVSLVRGGQEKPIFISDGTYWRQDNKSVAGGQPNNWDFSMTVSGAQLGWKVGLREGDTLRLNAVYDSQFASWYEVMGIVVGLVAPDDPHQPERVDVFDSDVTLDRGVPTTAKAPAGVTATCRPDVAGPGRTLCLRGQVTHGSMTHAHQAHATDASHENHSHKDGPVTTDIYIQNFSYGAADLDQVQKDGIPLVKVGEPVRFWNLDAPAKVWHTVTRCKEPCHPHGFAMADGGSGDPGDAMNFDSSQIGYGLPQDGAKARLVPERFPASFAEGSQMVQKIPATVRAGMVWEFTPTVPGTYTFFCRNHPDMRGIIKVLGPAGSGPAPGGGTGGGHDHGSGDHGASGGGRHPDPGESTDPSHVAHAAGDVSDVTGHDAHVLGGNIASQDHGHATAPGKNETGGHHGGGVQAGHQGHLALALALVALAGASVVLALQGGRSPQVRITAAALGLLVGGLGWDMVIHAASGEPLDLLENPGHVTSGAGIALLGALVVWASLPLGLRSAFISKIRRRRAEATPPAESKVTPLRRSKSR